MNVRARLVVGLAGRHRMVHDIAGLVYDVRSLRCIGFGRLFNHQPQYVQN